MEASCWRHSALWRERIVRQAVKNLVPTLGCQIILDFPSTSHVTIRYGMKTKYITHHLKSSQGINETELSKLKISNPIKPLKTKRIFEM